LRPVLACSGTSAILQLHHTERRLDDGIVAALASH